MPVLYGAIVRETDREILFAIAANLGDARDLGLCGQVWFAKRQIVRHGQHEGHDKIGVPYAVASLKALECQPCE